MAHDYIPPKCQTHTGSWGKGCPDCQRYNRLMIRRRSWMRSLGQPTSGDPERAIRHVQGLVTSGMSLAAIARRTGISWFRVNEIYLGRCSRILLPTYRALMAIEMPELTPYSAVLGIARRLQALSAAGFTAQHIADAHPRVISESSVIDWRRMKTITEPRPWARQAVLEVYEKLFGYAGPSKTAAAHARKRGWVPPEAWDDTTIDDPDAVPYQHMEGKHLYDEVKVQEALAGRLPASGLDLADQVEIYRRYTDQTGHQARTFRDKFGLSRAEMSAVLRETKQAEDVDDDDRAA